MMSCSFLSSAPCSGGIALLGSRDCNTSSGISSCSSSLSQFELKLSLTKAMASLPERNKLLLQLYYTHELNMKEIALVLELTESRVCQLHKQSVEMLSKKLAQW